MILAALELNDVETDELNVVIVVVTDELIVAIDDVIEDATDDEIDCVYALNDAVGI